MNHACQFHANKEKVTAALSGSLLAKAVPFAISVVNYKANHVQGGAATSRVQREISISAATNGPL